ncbi:MAG TPA: CHAT domain-containing protein [Rhizobiales bacterium]|nr:CHAT domain-containing protein [Hyphomicrobiales bacterium]
MTMSFAANAAQTDAYRENGFEAMQWAMLSSAGNAVQQLGLRAAAGSPELAEIVRHRQDVRSMIEEREKKIAAFDGLDPVSHANEAVRLRGEIDSLLAELQGIDERLKVDFPRYSELANPAPLTIAEVQALLEDDEALLVVFAGKYNVYTMAIARDAVDWNQAVYGAATLAEDVAQLRLQLDPDAAVNRGAAPIGGRDDTQRVAPFDRFRAHLLYSELVGPVAHVLAGKRHVFTVADGPLSGLPFSVLVTEPPRGDDTDAAAMRGTAWMIRQFAMTTLPSVSSLAVMRRFPPAHPAGSARPFVGFGAPDFGGSRGGEATVAAAQRSFFRGALADLEAVRNLPSLPQTGPELRQLASELGAGDDALFLGPRATESAVRKSDLSNVRILAFATHGLLSGDLQGLAEPALALSPPETATVEDDGLLTASEVSEMRLSAEWVILSACNTAGGDGRADGEGLSGLARAFLYAGARAILASHWPVRDDAAAYLTTRAVGVLAAGKRQRRAEALRLAMLSLMDDAKDPSLAHPSAWAPFVVVGEGGY